MLPFRNNRFNWYIKKNLIIYLGFWNM